MNPTKKSGVVLLGFSLLCFALPFVSVSCNNQKLSVTGLELAIGTQRQRQKVDLQPFALLALVASTVAFCFSFDKRAGRGKVIAILSGISAAFLLVLKSQVESQIGRGSGGFLQPQWEPGFWLALVSVAAAGVVQFIAPKEGIGVAPEQPTPPLPSASTPPD